jgi:hypothetical protein
MIAIDPTAMFLKNISPVATTVKKELGRKSGNKKADREKQFIDQKLVLKYSA